MKNITLITLIFCLLGLFQVSMAQTLNKNQWLISAGLMAGPDKLLPFSAQIEYGLAKNIGFGVKAWHGKFLEDGDRTGLTYLGTIATYHLADALKIQKSRFNPYVGVSLGVALYTFEDITETTPPLFGLLTGARYYFSNQVAAHGQINLSLDENIVTTFEVGLSLRFGNSHQ